MMKVLQWNDILSLAVKQAGKWAYPVKCRPSNLFDMKIGVPVDMSTTEFPVRIEVREE